MVFKQHTGKGIAADYTGDMSVQWERYWANVKQDFQDLEESNTWSLIRCHMPPQGVILEAGCGVGHWVRLLADNGYKAYGIDYSERTIKALQVKWPDLEFTVGDLRDMPYQDGFFDGIMSLGAIEHDEEGPAAALSEMYRCLRPGGSLFCTVPCYNIFRRLGLYALKDWARRNRKLRRLKGYNYDSVFWQYLWTPREYSEILAKAGFKDVRLEPLEPPNSLFAPIGSYRAHLVRQIHERFPWFTPHMMAGICRKP